MTGNLEISVQQTTDRLARAQMLSYSLEEESERWKQSLTEVDKTLKVLVSSYSYIHNSYIIFTMKYLMFIISRNALFVILHIFL